MMMLSPPQLSGIMGRAMVGGIVRNHTEGGCFCTDNGNPFHRSGVCRKGRNGYGKGDSKVPSDE